MDGSEGLVVVCERALGCWAEGCEGVGAGRGRVGRRRGQGRKGRNSWKSRKRSEGARAQRWACLRADLVVTEILRRSGGVCRAQQCVLVVLGSEGVVALVALQLRRRDVDSVTQELRKPVGDETEPVRG